MKVFLFLAEGFEEIEAIAPIDIFRRAGMEVCTVSITEKNEVRGAHGITILTDCLFSKTDFSDNDLLFLPGGMPGTNNLDEFENLKITLTNQVDRGKPLASICAAPSILGKMGLLEGKEAICYPGFEKFLNGAIISNEIIVKADNIYTAKAAGVAIPFALRLVEELMGKEVAEKLAESICY